METRAGSWVLGYQLAGLFLSNEAKFLAAVQNRGVLLTHNGCGGNDPTHAWLTCEKPTRGYMKLTLHVLENTSSRLGSSKSSPVTCLSGCSAIDELTGGFRGGELVEVFGPPSSGRSQLALSCAVRALAEGYSVLYVDADGGFVATRVRELLRALVDEKSAHPGSPKFSAVDVERAMERLLVNRVCSWDELAAGVAHTISGVAKQRGNVAMAVVDSVALPFRLCERENATKRLEAFAGRMAHVAMRHDMVVFLVNNARLMVGSAVSLRTGGDCSVYPAAIMHEVGRAAMGDNWAYMCPYRLGLGWSKDCRRVACLIKSSRMPRGRVHFQITRDGVVDVDDE
jgi:DNA repair protein RadB